MAVYTSKNKTILTLFDEVFHLDNDAPRMTPGLGLIAQFTITGWSCSSTSAFRGRLGNDIMALFLLNEFKKLRNGK
jgi:hypothetical protein